MQIKNGWIKYAAGKVFQSDWGKRQNIVVEMDDGSEEKLYFEKGRQPHASLKRGQQVQLLFSNGKRRLVVSDKPDTTCPEPQPQYQGLTPDTKRAIANYIQDQAKLMRYCLETARENFSEHTSNPDH